MFYTLKLTFSPLSPFRRVLQVYISFPGGLFFTVVTSSLSVFFLFWLITPVKCPPYFCHLLFWVFFLYLKKIIK